MADLDRVIRRGGVYWIRALDEWGGTSAPLGRPALVISNDYGNDHSPYVNIAFCSTQIKPHTCNVNISCCEKPTMVMCNKVAIIEKDRIGNKIGHCSDEEMVQIDETLALVFGLKLHKSDTDALMDALKARVTDLEEEQMAKRTEMAMLERLYEKAMGMLVDSRLALDLMKKENRGVPIPNEPEVAEEIVSCDKVNVNTATSKEINENAGIVMKVAQGIVGYRNRNGNYSSLEDLLNVPRFTQYHLDKYRERLTV